MLPGPLTSEGSNQLDRVGIGGKEGNAHGPNLRVYPMSDSDLRTQPAALDPNGFSPWPRRREGPPKSSPTGYSAYS
jgi:hypothetical protein